MAVATLTMESGPGSCRSTCRRRYTPYASAMTLLRSTIHNRSVSRGPNCGKEIVASLIAPPLRRTVAVPARRAGAVFPIIGVGDQGSVTRPLLLPADGGRPGIEPVHRRLQPFSYD